jgi:hypothetical protein
LASRPSCKRATAPRRGFFRRYLGPFHGHRGDQRSVCLRRGRRVRHPERWGVLAGAGVRDQRGRRGVHGGPGDSVPGGHCRYCRGRPGCSYQCFARSRPGGRATGGVRSADLGTIPVRPSRSTVSRPVGWQTESHWERNPRQDSNLQPSSPQLQSPPVPRFLIPQHQRQLV